MAGGGESDAESDGEKGQIAGWQEAELDRAAAVTQSAARGGTVEGEVVVTQDVVAPVRTPAAPPTLVQGPGGGWQVQLIGHARNNM